MDVLVDTSVWIDFLRDRKAAHVTTLARLLDTARVGLAPPVLQEILQGARTRDHQVALRRQFEQLPVFAFDDATVGAVAAARLYLDCRRAGKTPRSSNDCVIACIALENNLELFHNDRNFDAIATVEPRLKTRTTA
jgi:predicted nucleic acid-binding protein